MLSKLLSAVAMSSSSPILSKGAVRGATRQPLSHSFDQSSPARLHSSRSQLSLSETTRRVCVSKRCRN